MDGDLNDLVETWIKLQVSTQKCGVNSPETDALFWAHKKLDSICRKDANLALSLIRKIQELTDDDFVLENLAAGPLEDLLVRHGREIITEIEAIAKADTKFRLLLQMVWQNS